MNNTGDYDVIVPNLSSITYFEHDLENNHPSMVSDKINGGESVQRE